MITPGENGRSPRAALVAALACVLSGCAVGPEYRAPQPPTPDQWQQLPQTGLRVESTEAPSLAAWWRTFDDPQLNELIERALAGNTNVRQAISRVEQARLQRGTAIGGLLPSASASAGGNVARSPSALGPEGQLLSTSSESYNLGVNVSWELDIFGGRRRALEASTAQLQASEAELRDVLVSLLGDVALGYTSVRTAQSRLDYAERNLQSQHELLEITRWRAEAGLTTALEVEQAEANYEQTRAQLPSLRSSLLQAKNRLSVLIGEPPGAVDAMLDERRPVPSAPLEIVAGVPADVLRRRPDIRRAERQVAAQSAQVGVATAALYPSFSLSGAISMVSTAAGDLLDAPRSERGGLSLTAPIFRGGALRNNLKIQNLLLDQAVTSYEATVLAAYEEVENALDAWSAEQQRHQALQQAVASARLAAELALIQYNAGMVDFQNVLSADRQLISLEDSLALSDGERASGLIRLYKALGGGWSVFPETSG